MTENRLWFTRRQGVRRGPFPDKVIHDFIILGRLSLQDDVCAEGGDWVCVADIPQLVPEEVYLDINDPVARERIELARRRADERLVLSDGDVVVEQRLDQSTAGQVTQRRRNLQGGRNSGRRVLLIVMTAGFLVVLFFAAWQYQSPVKIGLQDCGVTKGANTDWNHCNKGGQDLQGVNLAGTQLKNVNFSNALLDFAVLDGADLSYSNLYRASLTQAGLVRATLFGVDMHEADLSGARLASADLRHAVLRSAKLRATVFRGADLTSADMRDANIESAVFEGARLGDVLWVDGRRCRSDSVGQCL